VTLLWVAIGAALGAPLRYLADRMFNVGRPFQFGTFGVNVAGSFVLAVLASVPVGSVASQILGVGFCGALTTYSTFGFELVLQVRSRPRAALIYALASLSVGLAAAFVGFEIGALIFPT
jgi:fluoride exporter